MIRILILIAVLAGLAFGGAWLAERPGAIVMTVEGRQIEMTLGVGVAILAALVVAAVILWGVLRFLLRIPSLVSFSTRARRRAKGFAAVSRGMVAVGAGDPRSARKHSVDASRLLGDDEPLALLLKAQTAQMTGDRGSAEGAFRQMLDEPETRVLGLRGLFVEARRKGDLAAARAYAAEAARLAPSVSWAGEAVLEYQCSEQDWAGALATLERGSRGLDKAVLKRQKAVLLTADAQARSEREPEAALARAHEALKLAPDLVPAAALAARQFSRRGDFRKASKVVESAWKLGPHPELAEAYVNVRPGDSSRDRLARAEKLHALRPGAAEGRMAVAEAALAGRDFARARTVLQPLLEGRPPVSVCLLMADLAEADESAHGSVREWLARASRAPRDAAWIADSVISDRWAPVSPVTGRLDAFAWGTPVEQIAFTERDAMRAERAAAAALPASERVIADGDEAQVVHGPGEVIEATPVSPGGDANGHAGPGHQELRNADSRPGDHKPAEPRAADTPAAEPRAPADARPAEDKPAPAPADRPAANGATAPTPPDQPHPADTAPRPPATAARTAIETALEGRRRGGQPTPVVFPLPAAPDDPGPDGIEGPRGARVGFLQ